MIKKRRKKAVLYFAEREEQAVIDYILTDSSEIRHGLYNNILRIPFKKMTESILRKYPIHIGNYDIREVEANALSHLVEHMIKYRPFIIESKERNLDVIKWDKSKVYKYFFVEEAEDMLSELQNDMDREYRISQSKAFSYCQTIVRNFYRDHGRTSYKEKKNSLSWEDYSSEVLNSKDYQYELDDNVMTDLEALITIVVDEMNLIIEEDKSLKKNEIIVGEAIIQVLTNWHVLFLEDTPEGRVNKKVTNKYQKNKILQLLKEQTRLNTKEIRMSMKPFKEIYYLQKNIFYNEES